MNAPAGANPGGQCGVSGFTPATCTTPSGSRRCTLTNVAANARCATSTSSSAASISDRTAPNPRPSSAGSATADVLVPSWLRRHGSRARRRSSPRRRTPRSACRRRRRCRRSRRRRRSDDARVPCRVASVGRSPSAPASGMRRVRNLSSGCPMSSVDSLPVQPRIAELTFTIMPAESTTISPHTGSNGARDGRLSAPWGIHDRMIPAGCVACHTFLRKGVLFHLVEAQAS